MPKKGIIIIVVLLIVWIMFFWYLVSYGELVRTDPCSICAKNMDKHIFCTIGGLNPMTRTYFPTGEIEDDTTTNIYSGEGEP